MPSTSLLERSGQPRTGLLKLDWERAITPPTGLSAAPLSRMYRPGPDSVAKLRPQQADFERKRSRLERENAWLAVPALAPVGVVAGLEIAAATAARLAPAVVKRPPLVLTERMPYLRVGDNWATRAGRRAHTELRAQVAQKAGWTPDRAVLLKDGRILKPDVSTPARVRPKGVGPKPYQMELKPNTPSGRKAADKALKKYEATGNKTRAIFYDPKPYI